MSWKKLNSAVSYWDKPSLKGKSKLMALTIDKSTLKNKVKWGVAREVYNRTGNADISGFLDRSKLILVKSKNLLSWKKVSDLKIKNMEKILEELTSQDQYCIGLEDPDIWEEKNIKHIYFTIVIGYKNKRRIHIHLGHAVGKSLDKLKATKPVISNNKEIAISPLKNKGYRYILAESWQSNPEEGISLLKAKDMNKNWKFIKLAFNPKRHSHPWCAGYASPCRIIDPSIIGLNNFLLGICTGNSGEYFKKGIKYRGDFKPGLFLFNPKTGEIPWISPKPLIEDPKATTITFASDFLQLNKREGLLYAHVNDSFVRAYKIKFKELRKFLP